MASRKTFLIVGGTSGLGASVVKSLGSSATVYVAGRTLPPSPPPNTIYTSLDVSSIKECLQFADHVAASDQVKEHGLAGIVLTAGNANFALSRRETKEGLESTFALNFLSKFAIINRLMPSLQRVNDSRVVSVMAGGNGGHFDANDIQMKKGYNCIKQAVQTGVLIDLMTTHLASLHQAPSDPKFFHLFPGIMNTNNPTNANLPFYMTAPLKLLLPLVGRDPDVVAKEVVSLLTSDEYSGVEKSGLLLHPGLKPVKPYSILADKEVSNKVWNECLGLVEKINKEHA
ncbi:hypothetical protein HDU98_005514 [Podochytrium sp. JEL0797]|nr:hypothetical protein HDU98_005514 [Podochytrium sp. JEL0797]